MIAWTRIPGRRRREGDAGTSSTGADAPRTRVQAIIRGSYP